jgi:ubiquinol-cytochrome c reductase cytochrome c subunit
MLAVIGIGYAALTGSGAAAAPVSGPDAASVSRGQQLFTQNCSNCHGLEAQGTSVAPSLIGVGSAAVDFQVSTGRMPAKQNGAENARKPVVFSTQAIRDLANYVSSLAGGPAIPTPAQVSTHGASVGVGQQLFIANCAACHNFVGAGGALTYGKFAPALNQATPTQIYEAMLTGPEAMPVFNNTTITPQEKRDIISYVTATRAAPNPGGFSLGRVGPVTEGLVSFLGLLLFMVLASMFITAKHRKTESADE